MFEKITPDTNITQEIQKKQFKITTEDLRRFIESNGEDEELNDKLRVWSTVEKNSLLYDETSVNSKTISVYNIPEPKDSEENSEIELSKGEKTWKNGKTDENGVEITYTVKQHILAEPDEEVFDYVDRNIEKLKSKEVEVKEISIEEVDNIINSIKKPKIEDLNYNETKTNKPTFFQRIKNWFGIK